MKGGLMAILVSDPSLEQRLLAEREAAGADRYDEVWEGLYMMAPMPNDEHQYLVARLVYILEDVVGISGRADVRPGVNLSGRKEEWKQDYRVPDVAVFLREGAAKNWESHWQGAADFLVEITSEGDRTREKIPFYTRLGVRELLVIDRDPWRLELFVLREQQLHLMDHSEAKTGNVLNSSAVPLSFRLVADAPRPKIEVKNTTSGQSWLL